MPLGYDKQRPPAHTLPPIHRLEAHIDPDLAIALATLLVLELVLAERPRLEDIKVRGERRPLVLQFQTRREDALAPRAQGRLGHGGARGVFVQEGGYEPAVHDPGPADGGGAKVDDVEDGGGRGVVKDVLVGADARGGAKGSCRDALGFRVGGEYGVGLVVCPYC